jgi:hypothetical protein
MSGFLQVQRLHRLLFFLAASSFWMLPLSSNANSMDSVTVRVDAISSVNYYAFDTIFDNIAEGSATGHKPDFFAVVRFLLDDGTSVSCGSSTPVRNLHFATPMEVVCSNVRVRRPYRVELEVWDADDMLTPPVAAFQADLAPNSPSKNWQSLPFVSSNNQQRTFNISGENANATITVTPTPLTSEFHPPGRIRSSQYDIDPTLNEQLIISGNFDIPSPVSVVARPLSGGADILIASTSVPMPSFNFDWNGKTQSGQMIPLGAYQIVATGPYGIPTGTLVTPLQVVRRPGGQLHFIGVNPSTGPQGTRYEMRFAASSVGNYIQTIYDIPTGSHCYSTIPNPALRSFSGSLRVGDNYTNWDGRYDDGTLATAGTYCIQIGASSPSGAPFNRIVAEVKVVNSPLFRVLVLTNPIAPGLAPGQAINIVAEALTTGNAAPHVANEIRIYASSFPGSISTVPIGSCQNVSICRISLPANLIGAGTLAYFAEASSINQHDVRSAVRLTDLMPPVSGPPAMRMYVAAKMDSATRFVSEVSRHNTIDVVHYPGTGYDLSIPFERTLLLDTLSNDIRSMFGLLRNPREPSIIFTQIDSMSFFVSTNSIGVENTPGQATNSDDNLCLFNNLNLVSFADVNAIQHRVPCRDNAPGSYYSTQSIGSISWHEFGHAALGLADEYAPDGGYWWNAPNVYNSLLDCQRRGSSYITCALLGGTPSDPSFGWWRSDRSPNHMMDDNGRMEPDDLRAAIRKFDQCDAGHC